jgi:hypothetical protein
MERITGTTVDVDLHGPGKDGFQDGTPGVTPATVVSEKWLNEVQEEIITTIERSGIPVDANLFLYEAIEETAGLRSIGVAIASHQSRTAPAAVDYQKIAYGEGLFVATCTGATSPHTSPDGVTWTARSAAALYDVCYAQGRFLCVGPSGGIVTSEDGVSSYTARTPAGGYADAFYCCVANGSVFLAAGENGEIQTSANGTSGWTHRTPAAAFAGVWFGAAVTFSGRFVLVGIASPDVITIQTSDDLGVTWTSRTPSEANGGVYSVAVGEPITGEVIMVAVGLASGAGPSLIMRSVDLGVSWENVSVPSSHDEGYSDVKYDANSNVFVAVGLSGQIAISRDGARWRGIGRASSSPFFNGVAFGDGTCVIGGNASALRQSLAFPWED